MTTLRLTSKVAISTVTLYVLLYGRQVSTLYGRLDDDPFPFLARGTGVGRSTFELSPLRILLVAAVVGLYAWFVTRAASGAGSVRVLRRPAVAVWGASFAVLICMSWPYLYFAIGERSRSVSLETAWIRFLVNLPGGMVGHMALASVIHAAVVLAVVCLTTPRGRVCQVVETH